MSLSDVAQIVVTAFGAIGLMSYLLMRVLVPVSRTIDDAREMLVSSVVPPRLLGKAIEGARLQYVQGRIEVEEFEAVVDRVLRQERE